MTVSAIKVVTGSRENSRILFFRKVILVIHEETKRIYLQSFFTDLRVAYFFTILF